jgi:hypothetical protein
VPWNEIRQEQSKRQQGISVRIRPHQHLNERAPNWHHRRNRDYSWHLVVEVCFKLHHWNVGRQREWPTSQRAGCFVHSKKQDDTYDTGDHQIEQPAKKGKGRKWTNKQISAATFTQTIEDESDNMIGTTSTQTIENERDDEKKE